jgi:hypothetical protein
MRALILCHPSKERSKTLIKIILRTLRENSENALKSSWNFTGFGVVNLFGLVRCPTDGVLSRLPDNLLLLLS